MRFIIAISVIVATLFLLIEWQTVDAVCCNTGCGSCEYRRLCHDCTRGTPCCGYGKCNIFCCNCDDGCRRGIGCSNCKCPQPPPPIFSVARFQPKCALEMSEAKQRREARRQSKAQVDRIVAEADPDKDGRMTLEDVQAYMTLNRPASLSQPHYVKAEFEKMDVNGDGFLTPDEIDH